jgi:hypothetical protein
MRPYQRIGVQFGLACVVGAWCARSPAAPPLSQPVASLQEIMQSVIDPSADGIWSAVETETTLAGETERKPRSTEEWLDVRRAAILLVESANLLVIEGRHAGAHAFPAEAAGALDSTQIDALITARRKEFNAFAVALRTVSRSALAAIDARDPVRLMSAGGALDQVCESCHVAFWYPNQVIPPLPPLVQTPVAAQADAAPR